MRKLKKAISLSLALVLSLALAVPAFAAEEKLKVSITFDGYLRTEYVKGDYENMFMAVQVVKDGSNVKLECPGAEQLVVEDEYERTLEVSSLQYTKGAGWVPGPAVPYLDGLDQDSDGVVIDASTKTFAATSADAGSFIFVVVGTSPLDPFYDDSHFDVEETYWMSESGYAKLAPEHKGVPGPGSEIRGVVGPAAGDQPTTPSQPAGTTAAPTNDKLTVDGNAADPTVYKINGSNYFKIRDVAALLNGTEKQFAVGYDGAKNAVTATTGQGYTKQSGDLAGAAKGGDQSAAVSNDAIYVNGEKITAEVYKIDGSNYFKLRDLGKALNFYVGWSKEQGVYIETDKPYSE